MTKLRYEIAVIPGDGIGPEVVAAAVAVMRQAAARSGLTLCMTEHPAGAFYFRDSGDALPATTILGGDAGTTEVTDATLAALPA